LQLVIEPVSLPVEATYPGLRDFVVEAHRRAASEQIAAARTALESAQKQLPAANADAPLPVEQAMLAVTIAEKALQTAEAQLASVDARAAAGRAQHQSNVTDGSAGSAEELAIAAAKSERILAAARASEELSRAELALLQAATDQKAEAENKVAAAKTALETARTAIEMTGSAYTPLPGAKKTQEDYQNRNADTPYLTTSSGRRSALAKWITDPRNPLPARVAVNHIWARHMGQPLVPTAFDFGRKGTPPTHPELLDWLAVELVEHNWSMKHIHRLIVSSQAYRMSSSIVGATESNLKADPDNRYYWRMNLVRMEAQVVRDSLLHLAGELDLSLGGPSIPINDESSRRRSLYYVHSHNEHQKFLSMFDDASVLDCYRRAESIVPQQALALENSLLVAETASRIAEQIADDDSKNPSASDAEFVRTAFMLVLSDEPSDAELTFIGEMLPRLTEAARANHRPNPESQARIAVIQALLNHNDFVTIR
jgi:hypothetical protein